MPYLSTAASVSPPPAIENKGNIDLVAKYYDKLAEALGLIAQLVDKSAKRNAAVGLIAARQINDVRDIGKHLLAAVLETQLLFFALEHALGTDKVGFSLTTTNTGPTGELPVGAITALLGGPVFLLLLRRQRRYSVM